MNLTKAYLASVCYITDKIIPNFESATDRWLAYGALAAYKGKVDKLFNDYSKPLSDMGIVENNEINVANLKTIGSFAFDKEPKVSMEIPVLNKKISFTKEDFETFISYLEQAEKS
jgi:hypothetical protein